MKKFLLLKFIIILMTKDIFGSSFNPRNSQKFESFHEGSTQINNNDMTVNSHVTNKDTSTENIDSNIAEFGSEVERLKDLMVDYIKANGKRPMTHEFNKNSKKFIDYLNFLLAKAQPGVMRNQIDDIVEKMNAKSQQSHGNFPNDGENEGQSEEEYSKSEKNVKQNEGFDYLVTKLGIENFLNPKFIDKNSRIFIHQIFKSLRDNQELKMPNFVDIASEIKLPVNGLTNLLSHEPKTMNQQNPIQTIFSLLQSIENSDDANNDNQNVALNKMLQNNNFQKLLNSMLSGSLTNPSQDTNQNFFIENFKNFNDQIYRNFKIDLTPKTPNFEEIMTKFNFAISQFFNSKTIEEASKYFMTQVINNLQMNENLNLQQILSSLNFPKNDNLLNPKNFYVGPTTPQNLIQQQQNILKQIISEYFNAIYLLMEDQLLKSRNAGPKKEGMTIKNDKEEIQNNATSATEEQKSLERENPQYIRFSSIDTKSNDQKSSESKNLQISGSENIKTLQRKNDHSLKNQSFNDNQNKSHENQNCTEYEETNTNYSNSKLNPISNAETNLSNISSETPKPNNKENKKISNQENEEKIKNSKEAFNCTDCGHYENSSFHSQEIIAEDKIEILKENPNCTDCGYVEKSANYSQQVSKSDGEIKMTANVGEEDVKIKNQEVGEKSLNSEKSMPEMSSEHVDISQKDPKIQIDSTKNFTESTEISSENPDQLEANNENFSEIHRKPTETEQNFPEINENLQGSIQNSSKGSTNASKNQSTSSENLAVSTETFNDKDSEIPEKNEDTEEAVTELNKLSAGTEELSRKLDAELEISTDKTTQNYTKTINTFDSNTDIRNSIDVSTSTQNFLEIVQGVDNSTEIDDVLQIAANSTESSLVGDDEASDKLKKLEEISRNLKETNFTENDMIKVENYRKEIVELMNYFRDTKYYENAHDIYKQLLSLTKTLEVFKITDLINISNETTENLQYIEKLEMKLNIIENFYMNKNQFLVDKAKELKIQLRQIINKVHNENPEIPQELIKINETYSNPENYNLKFLKAAKRNITSIIYTLKTIKSINLAIDLLKKVQILINEIYQSQQELKEIESQIKIPSNDTELTKLNEYKQRLSALQIHPEPSIYKKAIELDESIKKIIKEYQIKAEVNLALNKLNMSLEAAESGNEINRNMMELKNLEMKIESLDVNEEDIEKVKQLQMRNARVAVRNDGRVLYAIVNEFINIMIVTQSDIDNLNNQFLKLEQFNSSRFDLSSLNDRKNFIINDFNRIYHDLSDIRMKLEDFGYTSANNETLNQIKELNDISEVLEFLSGLDNLLRDSRTSKLYKEVFKNVQEVEQLRDALKNIFKFMDRMEYFEKKRQLSENRDENGKIVVNLRGTGSNSEYSSQNGNETVSNLEENVANDETHSNRDKSLPGNQNSEDTQVNGHDLADDSKAMSNSSKTHENDTEAIDQNQPSNPEGQSNNFETHSETNIFESQSNNAEAHLESKDQD